MMVSGSTSTAVMRKFSVPLTQMSSNMRVEELMQSGQLYPADDPEVLQELRHGR